MGPPVSTRGTSRRAFADTLGDRGDTDHRPERPSPERTRDMTSDRQRGAPPEVRAETGDHRSPADAFVIEPGAVTDRVPDPVG